MPAEPPPRPPDFRSPMPADDFRLNARTDISSVLVICPKALVTERKRSVEMKRFDERFEALDC